QSNVGRTFSAVFGSGNVPVRGRAVARGMWTSSSNSVMVLNLTASSALSLTGNANLKVNGGLVINSSSPSALNLISNGVVTASSITLNQAAGTLTNTLLNSLL